MAWMWLVCAIALEVVATSSLKAAEGFTRLWPSLIVVVGYCGSTLMLGLTLKTFDIGMVYAIWSGVGTAVILLIGIAVFDEPATSLRMVGIALIIVGIVMLNLSGGAREKAGPDDSVVRSDVTQLGGGDQAWDKPLNG
jgi:multidrug transporter EmrE-like cation transporter